MNSPAGTLAEKGALAPFSTSHLHLSCENRSGSVEHYYHFFLGYLYPLLLAYEKLERKGAVKTVLVRSCALMDPHLHALGLRKLQILPRAEHSALAGTAGLAKVTVPGYDLPIFYEYHAIRRATRLLRRRLAAQVATASAALAPPVGQGPTILLIGRKAPAAYYTSDAAEIAESGAQRRSIGNFAELANAIRAVYPDTREVFLEDRSLAEQIALFQQADIVVGQHGAALVNTVFCRSRSALVEIYPRDLVQPNGGYRNHFMRLAQILGLSYRRVFQDSLHSEVSGAEVSRAIDDILAKTSLPLVRKLRRMLRFHRWQRRFRRRLAATRPAPTR